MQNATLVQFSGYTEEEIMPVYQLMLNYLHGPIAHEAFFKKYASKKFLKGEHPHLQRVNILTCISLHRYPQMGQRCSCRQSSACDPRGRRRASDKGR